ncbi:malonyl CoA-ACP transacylase [Streptosporangium oxazolinicum]|uniref:Malonyl CoA-ACP transacylase n=1 Tax=Streptosporangium oxazolinicum TaxID=909287 RepID=A0ABP8ATG4_9ACTN
MTAAYLHETPATARTGETPVTAAHAHHTHATPVTGAHAHQTHATTAHVHETSPVAAWVGETPVTVARVEERVRLLRAGPRGPLLPADGTTEGRQLRRWAVQLLVTEQVVADEAARRGLSAACDPSKPPEPPEPPLELDATARLELGSVLAAVLAASPLAQALYREMTSGVTVGDREVAAYYAANQDRYRGRPARMVTHHHDDRPVNGGRRYLVRQGEFAEAIDRALFAAPEGAVVGPIERHTFVTGPLQAGTVTLQRAAPRIRADLLEAGRRRSFALWVDARCARAVLLPGFEHPGDIRQPDHTHRH